MEILVIGGGIMGLWLTWRYSLRGYHVLCLRLEDKGRPCAETLRNQGWLQSGGRYFRPASLEVRALTEKLADQQLDQSLRAELEEKLELAQQKRDFAVAMHYSAQEIQRDFGLSVPPPDKQGVLRVRDDEILIRELENWSVVEKLSIPELEAWPLRGELAKEKLGALFDSRGAYFSTSERSFKEDILLGELRARALATRRVRFRELGKPVKLAWTADSFSRAVCKIPSENCEVEASRVFLAAGAGTCCLLEDLGLANFLQVKKTPLLVGRVPATLEGLVLEERARRFSLVSHATKEGPLAVIGVGSQNGEPMDERLSVVQLQEDQVYGASARSISREIGDRAMSRVRDVFVQEPRITAGYEPSPIEEEDWKPWVHVPKRDGNIVVVMPGRATASASVAESCEACDFGHGEASWPISPLPLENADPDFGWEELPGSDWTEAPRMHFDESYSHMNEVED